MISNLFRLWNLEFRKEGGVLVELAEQTGEENLRKLKEIAAISNMKDYSDIGEDNVTEVDHNTKELSLCHKL